MAERLARRLPAGRSEVFTVIADPGTWPHWLGFRTAHRGPLSPGDRIQLESLSPGVLQAVNVTVTELWPDQFLRVRFPVGDGTIWMDWFLSDVGEGSTDLRVVVHGSDPGDMGAGEEIRTVIGLLLDRLAGFLERFQR